MCRKNGPFLILSRFLNHDALLDNIGILDKRDAALYLHE
jgi:hypothetical protein